MDVRVLLFFGIVQFAQSEVLNLSCEQIQAFVDFHNDRRLMLTKGEVPNQPPAVEMNYIVWDEELAEGALNAVSNYSSESDESTWKSRRFEEVTIIVAELTIPDPDYEFNVDDMLQRLFDNNKDYSYASSLNSNKNPYSQMVWSNSIYLGCAASQQRGDDEVTYVTACAYGPSGNVDGEFPYKAALNRGVKLSGILVCPIEDCSHPYGSKC